MKNSPCNLFTTDNFNQRSFWGCAFWKHISTEKFRSRKAPATTQQTAAAHRGILLPGDWVTSQSSKEHFKNLTEKIINENIIVLQHLLSRKDVLLFRQKFPEDSWNNEGRLIRVIHQSVPRIFITNFGAAGPRLNSP